MKKALNILLGILMAITAVLTVWAIATATDMGGPAINWSIMWAYALMVFAVLSAVFCAVFGMIKNPAGIKGTVISLALIIVVVGVAYFVSKGSGIEIDNFADGGVFGAGETILTETSIVVTYFAFAAAFIVAVATEVWKAFK